VTWVRLSDDWNRAPTLAGVPALARLLHVDALTYSNQQLLDGAIPLAVARALGGIRGVSLVDALIEAGAWARTSSTTIQIVTGLEHQPTRAQVLQMRSDATIRKARSRAGHGVTGGSGHGVTRPASRREAPGVTGEVHSLPIPIPSEAPPSEGGGASEPGARTKEPRPGTPTAPATATRPGVPAGATLAEMLALGARMRPGKTPHAPETIPDEPE